MRSWMIGTIMGIMPVALLATLPSMQITVLFLAVSIVVLALNFRTLGTWTCGVFLGLAVASWHGHTLSSSRLSHACEGVNLQLIGTIASLPLVSVTRYGIDRQRFKFDVTSVVPHQCAGPKSILLSYYGLLEILPGQNWQFDAKLKRPWGLVNPGGFNVQAWYAQERIDAVGTARSETEFLHDTGSDPRYFHHGIRGAIGKRMSASGLQPDSLGVLKALTIADKSGIDDSLWKLFAVFGINHLLVISGLHIGLVAGLGLGLGNPLSKLISLFGYQRYVLFLPQCAAAVFACTYAALAGFTLPTNRALIMLCTFLVASVFARRSSSWNNLLIAAFVVVVFNPLETLGSGFWLSFGAVAWLLWLNMWRPSLGPLAKLFYVHLGMSLVMMPLGGLLFGGASVISGLANFFMIPLVGLLVVPLSLLGAAAQWVSQDLGNTLFHLAAWPMDLLIPLARQLVEAQQTLLYHPFFPSLASVMLAVLGLCLLAARVVPRSLVLCIILCGPLLPPVKEQSPGGEPLVVLTVMDVGQGTSIVFRHGKKTLVYDTGGGNPVGRNLAQSQLIPYLQRNGVRELDTFVVSHGDTDHSAGANDLLASFEVKKYFSGVVSDESDIDTALRCVAGKAWQWSSSIRFQFLSPSNENELSSNNGSCVLQITVDKTRILLTGDIDRKREKILVEYWRDQLISDWMLAPHHGSNSSSSRLWLKYVQAKTLVFSSGYGNAFGHPHRDVIGRSKNGNTALYSTRDDGAIDFIFGRGGISAIRRYRKDHPRYWY